MTALFGGIWLFIAIQIINTSQNPEARWYILALLSVQLVLSYFVYTKLQKYDEQIRRERGAK